MERRRTCRHSRPSIPHDLRQQSAQLLDSSRKYGEHGRMKTIAVHVSEPVRSTTLADLDPVSVGRAPMPPGIDDDLLGEMLDHDRT